MKNSLITKWLIFSIFILSAHSIFAESKKILISEFMAINSATLVDGDGDFSDWIELYNPGESDVNLSGWFLSDRADNLKKWKFPELTIKKDSYVIIYASGKDTSDAAGHIHTSFKLSGSGEFLALSEPDSSISSSYSPFFPAQRQDVSYGLYEGQPVYFSTPSPGTENTLSMKPFAPNASVTRGFYDAAFDVFLSSASPDCGIYYTLDGTRPTKTSGTLFTAPIHIDKTTPLSAVCINSVNTSSEVVTNTYWFLDDIMQQSSSPAGYPSDWKQAGSSTTIKADYEMDSEVTEDAAYKDLMTNAMTAIPSMSIVTNKSHIFSNVKDEKEGGIYIYTGKPSAVGVDWVRPTSVEYLDPVSGKQFQMNCELKLHGGNSRNPSNSAKHGFQLAFRSEYGPSKLNFNLFDEKKVTNEFNSLVLRAGYNYSWIKNNEAQRLGTQYLQDPWTKNTQLDMGKTSGHERFVHLYINGMYWGLYNLAEKYSNDFFESYMKGVEEDFDIIKEKQVVAAGNINAFNALVGQMGSGLSNNTNYQKIQGKNADGTVNESYSNLLDIDNYIDYMLINYYIGNLDWNKNNWVMARNRVSNQSGFRFLCWDAETTMTSLSTNLVAEDGDSKNPMSFIRYLIGNKDFKTMLYDRIQKHMIDQGGALTPAEAIKRYEKLAEEIDLAIIGESARWGDYRRDVAPSDDGRYLYTRNDFWLPRKQDLLNDYFPQRTDIVIAQLVKKGYFTTLSAPEFSHESGSMSSAFDLGMTSNGGEIYYTTDGTDPREQITSNVASYATLYKAPINISSTAKVRARVKSSGNWSPLAKAKFDFDGPTSINDVFAANTIQSGNYPNPFHSFTEINFTLPTAGYVQVDIYSIDGKLIENLHRGTLAKGYNKISWHPLTQNRGIYLYKIKFDNQTFVGKMIRQ